MPTNILICVRRTGSDAKQAILRRSARRQGRLGQDANVSADYNPRTGEAHSNLGYNQSCYVREKRELIADCPLSMACTASGQCSAFGIAPQVIRLDTLDF